MGANECVLAEDIFAPQIDFGLCKAGANSFGPSIWTFVSPHSILFAYLLIAKLTYPAFLTGDSNSQPAAGGLAGNPCLTRPKCPLFHFLGPFASNRLGLDGSPGVSRAAVDCKGKLCGHRRHLFLTHYFAAANHGHTSR